MSFLYDILEKVLMAIYGIDRKLGCGLLLLLY